MANTQKENIFLRIIKAILPWKGDRWTEVLRKLIFIISAIVLTVSVWSLVSDAGNRIKDDRNNDKLSELYHGSSGTEKNDSTSALPPIEGSSPEETQDETHQSQDTGTTEEAPREIREEFLPLLEINEDIVGWITIGDKDDPLIDYVVVQGEDNDYYLEHNYMKEKSKSGSIFADYRDSLKDGDEPDNIVLYGHNMASGEYFAKLIRFFNYRYGTMNEPEYYRDYPTITFSTRYEEYTYKIIAGMMVNTQESEGDVFYYLRGRNFKDEAHFNEYIGQVLDRSTFYTETDVQYGDPILTLSTCILDYQNWDLRWVMYARRVREGEDPSVDVSKAYANPDPLFFDAYYLTYGGGWGGRKWPSGLLGNQDN